MAYKSCKMRAVAEILSCPVNASSRRGTEWPGSPFLFFFVFVFVFVLIFIVFTNIMLTYLHSTYLLT